MDHTDFGSLDPARGYGGLDYEAIYATQSPLFFFPPNDARHAVPLLASGPAVISDGGRTVTVHIRHGVRFSPPVNREVTASDVGYAIERGANPSVANPYFPAYFGHLVGATGARGGPIPGISTPARYTIVFHLTGPYGSFFVGALSLPLSAPVPREYAAPLDAKNPGQYGSAYEVDTGPYMLESDSTGKFLGLGYQPGSSATLVRNPNWSRRGDPRPAYLDRIKVRIGGDPYVIGRQVLDGSHMVQGDAVAGPVVKLAYEQHYDQLVAVPGGGVGYAALNNKRGPFSHVDVRRALWAALDRAAILKAIGGPIAGRVGTHFIYPGSIGYALAGGDRGSNLDYNDYPAGNMSVATKYMKLAGYPAGRYTGGYTVRIVGGKGDPYEQVAEIANNAVQSLGFKTNLTLLDPSVAVSKYCTVPAQEIDVCPQVWWRDWADPQTILDLPFAGYHIVKTGNSNFGQVSWQDGPDGPHPGQATTRLDLAIRAAEGVVGERARAAAWAEVDKKLVANAVAVPAVFPTLPGIESADVHGINDQWNLGAWDYNYTSLK